jgi:hypothetical protein
MNNITKQIDAQRGKRGEVFKTDHFTDDQHEKTKANANKQEAKILELLECFEKGIGATWLHTVTPSTWLITSVRRALNSLAKQGKVEKMQQVARSLHGRNEHLWRLKK